MVLVVRVGRTFHGFKRTRGDLFERSFDEPAVKARMVTLIVVIEQIVVGGRTQRGIGVKLADFDGFLDNAPPRAGLFRQLAQDAERSFGSFVIENVRMRGSPIAVTPSSAGST